MKKQTSALTLRLDPELHKQLKLLSKDMSKFSGEFVSVNALAEQAIKLLVNSLNCKKLDRKK